MKISEVLESVRRIGARYQVRQIWLFGSRAKGTATERSDVDLAIAGAGRRFGELNEEIQRIPTLLTLDVVNLDICRNQSLMEDIVQYGRKIYEAV